MFCQHAIKTSKNAHSDQINPFIRRNNVLSIKRFTKENDDKLKLIPPQLKFIGTIHKNSTKINFSLVINNNHLSPSPAPPLAKNLPSV